MSLLRKRALLGLATVSAALALLPASALAAGETLTVAPVNVVTPGTSGTGTPSLPTTTPDDTAGSSPSILTTMNFDPSEGTSGGETTPQTVVADLAPGLLSNLNANPACLAADPASDPQQISGCDIGQVWINTFLNGNPSSKLTASGDLYLEPPAPGSGDVAGIDVNITWPTPQDDYLGVAFNPSSPGSLALTSANLPTTAALAPGVNVTVAITSITTLFNDTVDGHSFNRLPTSCNVATSSMHVTYYPPTGSTTAGTGSATDQFTPTGCSSLPYSPKLTAAINVDSTTGGAELKTDVTQAADEAASKALSIQFPSGLTPNAGALASCLTGTPCQIGTASATSPLMPQKLSGTVTLGGSVSAPTMSLSFPSPANLTMTGTFDLAHNSVTFSNVPDVPLSDLSLDITGVKGQRAFLTDCKAASLIGRFTGQGGQSRTVTAPITLTGKCPAPTGTGTGTGTGTPPPSGPTAKPKPKPKPKASGSVAGLASGHPRLKFKLTDAPGRKLAQVSIGLPGGLKFARSAIVSHKVCTKKGKKKKCTTTRRVKGFRISGGSAKTVALKAGRLVVTLKKATRSVTITANGPLVTESKSLRTKVKKHKAGKLSFKLKLTSGNHSSTTLTLKLKA